MDTRLIVTGHDDNGKAIVARDDAVAPITLSMMPGTDPRSNGWLTECSPARLAVVVRCR